MADLIQLRRGTETDWAAIDPVLAQGEFAVTLDSLDSDPKFKIGDGIKKWSELLYIGVAGETPEHNQLDGLQGGSIGEYYHLTETETTSLGNLLAFLTGTAKQTLRYNTEGALEAISNVNVDRTASSTYHTIEFPGTLNRIETIVTATNQISVGKNLDGIGFNAETIAAIGSLLSLTRVTGNQFMINVAETYNANSSLLKFMDSDAIIRFQVKMGGAIMSKDLAGTGDRPLLADENGNIEAGSADILTNSHSHTNKTLLDGIIAGEDGDVLIYDETSGLWLPNAIPAPELQYFEESRSVAAPNATVPAHKITPKGDETNIDAVISPKGTGAILAQIPDGTATGGNKRLGNYALDLQRQRASANNIAGGNIASNNATIINGHSNEANGTWSFIANGYNNIANGQYSIILNGYSNLIYGELGSGVYGYKNTGNVIFYGEACEITGRGCSIVSGYMAKIKTKVTGVYLGNVILSGKSNIGDSTSREIDGNVICGGNNHKIGIGVLASKNFIGSGSDCEIKSNYCGILTGYFALAQHYGQQAHASGRFAAVGDAQRSDYVLRGHVLTTNYYRLYLDNVSALIDLSQAGAYSTWQCKLRVTGLRGLTGAIDHYVSEHNFMIYRENGTPVIADYTEIHVHQVAASSVATGVSITTNSLAIDIATTENNWQFVAHLETVETFSSSLV